MPIDIALRNDAQIITSDRGNYWRYYGLHCDPFAPGIVNNETYLVPRWEEYCDLLHYLCHSSNALLVVNGLKGSGKTTFMHQFMAQVDEATYVCQLLGTPVLDVENIIAAMLKTFSLPAPQGETLEERFESLVMNLQQSKHSCLLIIDDAHRLHESALKMLLSLIKQQSESQMRLHILLLGTPRLSEVFTRFIAADGERELVHHVDLEALSLEETHRYIKHRLAIAGLPAAVPLSQATINRIHNLSEGILGRINVVARQALIDGMRQPQLHAALDFIRSRQTQFIGGGILFAALIFAAITLARGSHVPHFSWPKFHRAESVKAESPKLDKTAAEHKVEPVKEVASVSTPVINQAVIPVSANQETAPAFMQPTFDFTPAPQPEKVLTETTVKPQPQPKAQLQTQVQSRSAVATAPQQATPAKQTVVEEKVVNIPEVVPPVTAELVTSATTTKPITKTVSVTAPIPAKKKEIVKKTMHHSTPMEPGWLQKANPQHYTLQLMGLSSEQGMRAFIADNELGSNATYIRTHRRTKDWYVLVMGDYATMQQAQAAIRTLPKDLQDFHPWPRKIGLVQQPLK